MYRTGIQWGLHTEKGATSQKVEVNRDFSMSEANALIEGSGAQKKFTPQLFEKLQKGYLNS